MRSSNYNASFTMGPSIKNLISFNIQSTNLSHKLTCPFFGDHSWALLRLYWSPHSVSLIIGTICHKVQHRQMSLVSMTFLGVWKRLSDVKLIVLRRHGGNFPIGEISVQPRLTFSLWCSSTSGMRQQLMELHGHLGMFLMTSCIADCRCCVPNSRPQ